MEDATPFVAREDVVEQLLDRLGKAGAGAGNALFLSGDAGAGKTTLTRAFIERAEAADPELVAAVGSCATHTGVGDPYLPFREILGQLTGDTDEKFDAGEISNENAGRLKRLAAVSGEALVNLGPDLIGCFVPGAGLVARALTFLAGKRGWMDQMQQLTQSNEQRLRSEERAVDQSHIFEQYLNVIKKLAESRPLLLVLDDLQWADQGSIDLLFHLVRRIGSSPIMILGTYRPAEVALGRLSPLKQEMARHPLEKLLAEFKRYYGDVTLDLNAVTEASGKRFVDALIDTEPNRLDGGFRESLYAHTGGHPLFTVELVRDLQESGALARDESGDWVRAGPIDWEELPGKVEGVIEERIGRLEKGLQEILRLGSVEGESFTAEIVAELQGAAVRKVIHELSSELEKRHRLVVSEGIETIPSRGRRVSHFRFRHNLFRLFLYNGLSEAERAYLHEDIGALLERYYGQDDPEIVVQLAFHFHAAGSWEKAGRYLFAAGNRAMLNYANQEALRLFSRALEMPGGLSDEQRYELHLRREKIYHWEGMRAVQKGELEILGRLADRSGEAKKLAESAYRRSLYFSSVSEHEEAAEMAERAIRLARESGAIEIEIDSKVQLGQIDYWHRGEHERAARLLEQARLQAERHGLHRCEGVVLNEMAIHAAVTGRHAEAEGFWKRGLEAAARANARRLENSMRGNLGRLYTEMGRVAVSEKILKKAVAEARRMGSRRGEGNFLNNLSNAASIQGKLGRAMAYARGALEISVEVGNRSNEGFINGNIGNLAMQIGDHATAERVFLKALAIGAEIGSKRVQELNLGNLAKLHNYRGDVGGSLKYAERGLALSEAVGDPVTRAYLLLWRGCALAGLGRGEEGKRSLEEALATRRELKQAGAAADCLAELLKTAEGDDARAHREGLVEQIRRTPDLPLSEDPARVYLICIEHLMEEGDPRGEAMLERAFEMVRERALKIGARKIRRAYLEDVEANRRIVELHGGGRAIMRGEHP